MIAIMAENFVIASIHPFTPFLVLKLVQDAETGIYEKYTAGAVRWIYFVRQLDGCQPSCPTLRQVGHFIGYLWQKIAVGR
jgi:hypothetical protein